MSAMSEQDLAKWLTEQLHKNTDFEDYSITSCLFALDEDQKVHYSSCNLRASGVPADNVSVMSSLSDLLRQAIETYDLKIEK